MPATCVEIQILRRVRAESSRTPPRHRREHPTHWLISTQPATSLPPSVAAKSRVYSLSFGRRRQPFSLAIDAGTGSPPNASVPMADSGKSALLQSESPTAAIRRSIRALFNANRTFASTHWRSLGCVVKGFSYEGFQYASTARGNARLAPINARPRKKLRPNHALVVFVTRSDL